jgi:hypothetical protein
MSKTKLVTSIITAFVVLIIMIGVSFSNAFAVDPGTIKWKYPLETEIRYAWTCAPALNNNGSVIFVPVGKKLLAINIASITADPNGVVANPEEALLWSYEAGDEVETPSVSKNDKIYFRTDSNEAYAIDQQGNLIWKYNPPEGFLYGGTIFTGTAINNDNTIYFYGGKPTPSGFWFGQLHALDEQENIKWILDYSAGIPAIGFNDTLYARIEQGSDYALAKIDKENGSILAKSPSYQDFTQWPVPSIGANGDVYLVGTSLFEVFSNDVIPLWNYQHKGRVAIPPGEAVTGKDGMIYFYSYVPSTVQAQEGYIHALSADGTKNWTYYLGPRTHEPAGSPVVGDSGIIYVVETNGMLGMKPPMDSEWTPEWMVKNPSEMPWTTLSSPIMGPDGSLYFVGTERDYPGQIIWKSYLYCVQTESTGPAFSSWPMMGANAQHTHVANVYTYSLSVSTAGTGNGTISSSDGKINCGSACTSKYNSGSSVELMATPNAGSTFAYWDDGTTCFSQNPLTIQMNSDRTLTAIFTVPLHIDNSLPISGNTIMPVVANGKWTGQPSTCSAKLSTYSNDYLNYYAIDDYYALTGETNPYYWIIHGSGLGTQGEITFSNPNISGSQIVYWKNNEIKIIPSASYDFEHDDNLALTIKNQWGLSDSINLPVVGMLKSRAFGQCTWYVAKTLISQGKCIPPSAYSTTGTVDEQYEPHQWDALTFGQAHVAIITSGVSKTEAPQGANTIVTYSFTVGEMNANCGEKESTYNAQFVIKINSKGKNSVVRNDMSAIKKSAATGYYRTDVVCNYQK